MTSDITRENGQATAPATILQNKSMPHNDDAERAVLAAMVLDEDILIEALAQLRETDLYRPSHRRMFTAMRELSERNIPVDQISLADHLASKNELEGIGGKAYIIEVASNSAATFNWEHHARIVSRNALLRQLINASAQITALAYDAPDDTQEVVVDAEKLILSATEQHISDDFRSIGDLLTESFDQLAQLADDKRTIRGLTTGFKDLDRLLSGMRGGDLIILAARPGMGKTALALNMSIAAAKSGASVAMFSLEMPASQLVQRILCAEARVDMGHLNSGRLTDADWTNLTQACAALDRLDYHIDDTPALSLAELRAKVRRQLRGKSNGLIVLDYLQLMSTPGAGFKDRYLEVASFSRGLKVIAKELDIPVLALSQLNRSPEMRSNKRPQLSDLRESGSIEQDADVVMFIDRSTSAAEAAEEGRPDDGEATIIVAKHRNGAIDDIPVVWQGRFAKFMDLYRGDANVATQPTNWEAQQQSF